MLKNYRVTLRRTAKEIAHVTVAADRPTSAADAALELEEEGKVTDWICDEGETTVFDVDELEDAE